VILIDALVVFKFARIVDPVRQRGDAREYAELLSRYRLRGVRTPSDAEALGVLLGKAGEA
jgi:hypothetical protein